LRSFKQISDLLALAKKCIQCHKDFIHISSSLIMLSGVGYIISTMAYYNFQDLRAFRLATLAVAARCT